MKLEFKVSMSLNSGRGILLKIMPLLTDDKSLKKQGFSENKKCNNLIISNIQLF